MAKRRGSPFGRAGRCTFDQADVVHLRDYCDRAFELWEVSYSVPVGSSRLEPLK